MEIQFPRHLVASQQFDRPMLDHLFELTREMESYTARDHSDILEKEIIATLFYEPSTRTRFSFESAVLRLGGQVISTENARDFSSAAKGETIEDTIRVIGGYADLIVMRHHESGAALRAAGVNIVPIINAGDGVGQHPTQALLDVYTIQKHFGKVDGLTIAMMGDLAHGRTVRSLCYLLAKYPVKKIYFVAPKVVEMRDDIKEYLIEHSIDFAEEPNLLHIIGEIDVLYQTRIQKERFGDNLEEYHEASGKYIIDIDIAQMMKDVAIIMHPLPRLDEIKPEVDANHRAMYFEQAKNGLYVRMAILSLMLGHLK